MVNTPPPITLEDVDHFAERLAVRDAIVVADRHRKLILGWLLRRFLRTL